MFQKFNTNTLMSSFIKQLLSKNPLPQYNIVIEDDIIIGGCYYLYDNFIIRCEQTGRFIGEDPSTLYPSDKLYPSIILYPGNGEPVGTYKVVAHYTRSDIKSNFTFKSNCSYYDSETHRHLGDYLRYLRYHEGLNLMSYYNCYSNEYTDRVRLVHQKPFYELKNDSDYKVVSIPIKFNRTYTIAIDCFTEVQMRCIIQSPYGMILNGVAAQGSRDYGYLSDHEHLLSSYRSFPMMDFTQPITYKISTTDPNIYTQEKYLKLLIQLPATNNSSIVVLEDLEQHPNVIECDENSVIHKKITNSPLSLLLFDNNKSYAFSDRLIEYLTDNIIHSNDIIYKNIERVQKALDKRKKGDNFDPYHKKISDNSVCFGVWDEGITQSLIDLINEYSEKELLVDMDTNVNKDIERILMKVGKYNDPTG